MIYLFLVLLGIMVVGAIKMGYLTSDRYDKKVSQKEGNNGELSVERFHKDIAPSNQGISLDGVVEELKKEHITPKFFMDMNKSGIKEDEGSNI